MQKYGLIGYPLKHSFSIGYFNEKFKAENIDAEYVNFEIPRIEDFMEVIEENPNLCGLNVTIPYKEQVIPYLDELDKDTAKIGAVNVIKIVRLPKGKIKLIGCNSDIIGFTQSIEPLLQPQHKKALILGTGCPASFLKPLGHLSLWTLALRRVECLFTLPDLRRSVKPLCKFFFFLYDSCTAGAFITTFIRSFFGFSLYRNTLLLYNKTNINHPLGKGASSCRFQSY